MAVYLGSVFRSVEPVVVCVQLANTLYATALQMVVKERCSRATNSSNVNSTTEDDWQKAMSNFYMTYKLISQLTPILTGLLLARLGDLGWRKFPIVVPLAGYMLSRPLLLSVLLLGWPLEIVWAEVGTLGLCGGFSSFWAGTMALVSLNSTERDRSKLMMRVELVNGIAGLVGSTVSGHLFQISSSSLRPGVVTSVVCMLLHAVCLLYAIFLLQVTHPTSTNHKHQRENNTITFFGQQGKLVNIVLLLVGGILYNTALGGAKDSLVIYEMKEPLHWGVTQVGYGNASGFFVILTSFLGAMVLSQWLSDLTLIIIGMVSFSGGIFFMAFVTETYMFYLARVLTLFALIPLPTIRSLLSQQVQGSSYGIILISLQLSFKVSSVGYTPLYAKVYQHTLDWFPGFVFILSSIFTILATIPICVARRRNYVTAGVLLRTQGSVVSSVKLFG
ncbi:solute carrier family 46 member 2-like [Polymixia lowei]